MTQDAVFEQGEGDQWFLRNFRALTAPERLDRDPVLRLVGLMGLVPGSILEIGAANGYRLEALRRRFNCEVVAVEVSQEAITDGRSRYPAIEFLAGTASSLPIAADGQFDLVVANFVLHWVDRSMLLRSLAEIDRMVKDGGYVIIGDFHPGIPERVSYHHRPDADVWTFKQSYIDVLLASNLYELHAFITYEAGTHELRVGIPRDRRCAVSLVRKVLVARYESREFMAPAGNDG